MIVSVNEAVALLKKGEIAALPTETVYGLAGSISHPGAISKIFTTKERPSFDPLIVHIGRPQQIFPLISQFSPAAQKLAAEFWPGPLTLVLKKSVLVSDAITSGHDTVAIRMPAHAQALAILAETGPLAAPSANKFGKVSPTMASHVESEFQSLIPVVDGGACTVGVESTILRVNENETAIELSLLRPGMISREDILRIVEPLNKRIDWVEPDSKIAPGHLPNHYQPTKPLVLSLLGEDWSEKLHKTICEKLAMKFTETPPVFWSLDEPDPRLAARTMYGTMRGFSETSKAPYIFLKAPAGFLSREWEALRDRLEKASSLKIERVQESIALIVK